MKRFFCNIKRFLRFRRILLILFTAIILFSGCIDISERLDNYLQEAYNLWNFNGSVLISWNGKVLLNKGYGWANKELTIPNTPQTKYFIGSITKQFTAAAIMILAERNRVNLYGTINEYLQNFKHPDANRITIHQLLTHTSGLPNYTDNIGLYFRRTEDINPDSLVRIIEKLDLLFDPGGNFYYSNSGYILLGAIIESVSGQSYEAFLHKEIFKPLEMNNTGYGRREAGHPNRAYGYTLTDRGLLESAVPVEFSFLHSAGALYSTTEDLLKWEKALLSDRIVSKNMLKKMITGYGGPYGYGWFIERKYDTFHTFHDGLIDGYNSFIDRWPEYDLSIIILSNDDMAPVEKIARGLAAICYGLKGNYPIKKTPIPLGVHDLSEYCGVYKSDDGHFNIINAENDRLYVRQINQQREQLLPQAPDSFYYELDNSRLLLFHRNITGDIVSIEIVDDASRYISLRLDETKVEQVLINRKKIEINPNLLKLYSGRYRMNSSFPSFAEEFILEVHPAQNSLIVNTTEKEAIKIYPSSNESFFHEEADFQLTFIRNMLGEVIGCVLRLGLAEIFGEKINNY